MRAIETDIVNETKGYLLCDPIVEPLADTWLGEDATMGEIYRASVKEYGRCTSKVYVDTDDGTQPVGWHFVKRVKYDDADEYYLQGAWVTVGEYVPAVPTHVDYAA